MFPPKPTSFRGRKAEIASLTRLIRAQHPTAIALIGAGGSGKSTLACALGHAVRREFPNRAYWARIGSWDRTTILQLLCFALEVKPGASPLKTARDKLGEAPAFVVLDNHEDDTTTAGLLEDLAGLPVSWVITARRCLLSGVTLHPVTPPLSAVHQNPFPRVASLTRLLRWHPVALDLADALVQLGVTTDSALSKRLIERRVNRIAPVAHEDDVVEVRAMVAESMATLTAKARRMLSVLAHMRGDHMDADSLERLAANTAVSARKASSSSALEALIQRRLVLEHAAGHYALHATVRHAVRQLADFDETPIALHYLSLFEREPERARDEQTQLFGLMDWAQERGELALILRVHAVAERADPTSIDDDA